MPGQMKRDMQPRIAGAMVLAAIVLLFLLRHGFHGVKIGASVS